jgi:hypothetical protein
MDLTKQYDSKMPGTQPLIGEHCQSHLNCFICTRKTPRRNVCKKGSGSVHNTHALLSTQKGPSKCRAKKCGVRNGQHISLYELRRYQVQARDIAQSFEQISSRDGHLALEHLESQRRNHPQNNARRKDIAVCERRKPPRPIEPARFEKHCAASRRAVGPLRNPLSSTASTIGGHVQTLRGGTCLLIKSLAWNGEAHLSVGLRLAVTAPVSSSTIH